MDYSKYVRICKRVNNKKRNYLVLNEAQCKHFPSSPNTALEMFSDLASCVSEYQGEKGLLVVGFAETATAIGATVATYLYCDFITTTREYLESDFIQFSESHSHATEQKLMMLDFKAYKHILFVEDEVTTGDTILKAVKQLRQCNPELKFSVASILNGMSEENLKHYDKEKIDVHYLVKLDNSEYAKQAEATALDGIFVNCFDNDVNTLYFDLRDTKHLTNIVEYNDDIDNICKCIPVGEKTKSILVLGTEECMYPAIRIGAYFEGKKYKVKSHSTTRSPIGVSLKEGYPLNTAYKLHSCYDWDRRTFIYNLDRYDEVFIVTNAEASNEGLSELITVVKAVGNTKVTKICLEEITQ